MAVQEHHDVPNGFLILPALTDAGGAPRPDPGHVLEAVGFGFDHREDGGAEGVDQAVGKHRADALDQTGPQILFDAGG